MNLPLTSPFSSQLKTQRLRWVAGFILLFVFTQMAGLVHAEIHAFHEHETSCDVFNNLVQPVDKAENTSFEFFKPIYDLSGHVKLVSVHEAVYQPHVYGRAPPLA